MHDLRRTARSLMSRAGVNSDYAERCLGHVIGGVRGTYDRHEYHAEKQLAFEKLAAQIERIVNPQENTFRWRGADMQEGKWVKQYRLQEAKRERRIAEQLIKDFRAGNLTSEAEARNRLLRHFKEEGADPRGR